MGNKVPWMSGLVSGLQNHVRRFESARNLKETSETAYNKAFRRFFFFGGAEIGANFNEIISLPLNHPNFLFEYRELYTL